MTGHTHLQREQLRRSAGFWLAVVLAVGAVTKLARTLGFGLVDDSYIFLRYARNLAEGLGPVFNTGERVEGFSSPLWTLLLGVAGLLGIDLETAAAVLGWACGAGLVFLLAWALRRECGGGAGVAAGLGLATSPVLVFWSASGMDTPLFALLVTASLLAVLSDYGRGRLGWGTVLLLLLVTTARMEGVLVVGYAALLFLRDRRSLARLAAYATAVGVLLLARHAYYGEWVPNTFHAKVTADLPNRVGRGAAYLAEALGGHGPVALAVVLALLGLRRAGRGYPVAVRFFGGWILLWLSYVLYVGGDHFSLFRFWLPVLPALLLILGWAYALLLRRAAGPRRRAVLCGGCAAMLASNALAWGLDGRDALGEVALVRGWARTGRWLACATPPDATIATPTIGAIGYFSDRRIVDMLGLTDRTVARDGQVYPAAAPGHARYHTDYLFARAPDLVVYLSSGQCRQACYRDPGAIPLPYAYALYDFVSDPRCRRDYRYQTVPLADGTLVELQKHRGVTLAAGATGHGGPDKAPGFRSPRPPSRRSRPPASFLAGTGSDTTGE